MTINEFGKTIKQKYPQYNDLPDSELGKKMLAKYPQYQDMVADSQQILQQRMAEEKAKGKKESKVTAWGIAKQVPSATAQVLAKPIAQFGVSALETPTTIRQSARQIVGLPMARPTATTQKEYKLPLIGKFKSFQSEFEPKYKEAMKPETSTLKAYGTALRPFVEVPLAGLQTGIAAKGLIGDITLTGAKAGQITKGLLPKAYTAITEKGALKSALNIIKPKLTLKTKEQLLKEGRINMKGKVTPNQEDLNIAESIQKAGIKGYAKPDKNIKIIYDEIDDVSNNKVMPSLEKVKKLDVPDELKPLAEEARKYNSADEFVNSLAVGGENRKYGIGSGFHITSSNHQPISNSNKLIEVYRGVPKYGKNTLVDGDYISTNFNVATTYGDKVQTIKVPENTLYKADGKWNYIYSTGKTKSQLINVWNMAKKTSGEGIDDLVQQIKNVQPSPSIKFSAEGTKTFDNFKNVYIDELVANVKDPKTEYLTRIRLDREITNASKGKVWDDNVKALYEGVRKVRQVVNSHIASQLESPNEFLNSMKYENNLFNGIERIAENSAPAIGKSFWVTKLGKIIKYGSPFVLGATATKVIKTITQ